MSQTEVYIVGAKRTPVGAFLGALKSKPAPELGAHAVAAALTHARVAPERVDEVILGNVISAGLKQAPARQAMRLAKLPDSVGATTVNKVCGSGMKATMLGFDLVRAGSASVVVSGGMENMTLAPYLITKARGGLRMGHGEIKDTMFLDGLEDADTGRAMGTFAQATADAHQLTREEMDAYAATSVNRALQALDRGVLADETVGIDVDGVRVTEDETPRRVKLDRIPTLRPAFKEGGTITAANSSSISDGASALVLAGADTVARDALTPLVRIAGHATHSQAPAEFTTAPATAIRKLLERLQWRVADVDLFEINEAFALVTMLAIRDLGLDADKVNIYGGACAQGHPIGSTGSRLIVTLAHALCRQNARRGIASLCIGGGEATAIALERV